MFTKKHRCALIAALLLAINAAAAPQTINTVTVRNTGDVKIDPSSVLAKCTTEPGMILESTALETMLAKDVRALMDTGLYSYAGVEMAQAGQKINVIFVITPRYKLKLPLEIIETRDILGRSKIMDATGFIKEGLPVDDTIVMTAAGKLRDEFAKKDYPNAAIGAELIPAEGATGYASVRFTIEAGEKQALNEYVFVGNSAISSRELAATFGSRPWYDPRGWFVDLPINDSDLDDARLLMRTLYLDKGYLDAAISEPERRAVPGKEGQFDVVFTIKEGAQYTIDTIALTGEKLFPAEAILGKNPLKSGSVAGQATLAAAREAVVDYYGNLGYVDTLVKLTTTGGEKDDTLSVKFEVTEGEKVTIRNIVIKGNSRTKDKVIRRELLVAPEQTFNLANVKLSENRLKNLNYFNTVNHYTLLTDEQGIRDLVFEVDDSKSTGNFMLGFGFSSVDNLVGYAEITESNFDIFGVNNKFHGGGQRARLGAELGSRRQTVEASLIEPWFLDRPLSLKVEAYRRMRWYDHYDEVRTGASASLAWAAKIGKTNIGSVGVRYTLENVEYKDEDTGTWYYKNSDNEFSFQNQDDGINSKVGVFWNIDTRDNPFIPTRGIQSSVFADLGMGGDAKTYKLGFNYSQWHNVYRDHVLLTRFRAETVDAYSGDVPMFDRLFLGGGRTVRGFKYRDMGSKVYRREGGYGDHAAIGGQTTYCGTIEYTIPIFTAVRFAAFCDFGSVGDDAFDVGGDFGASVGAGLRIDIPGFPIRFDFAKPFINDDDSDEETFIFWIGF